MDREKELLLLSHFRRNSRQSLTKISRETRIPVSTIFDKLKEYEQTIIKKHTCLLNFKKLGFDLRTTILFKVEKEKKESFQKFLLNNPSTNNVFKINNGYDFLIEAIFRDLREMDSFFEDADNRGVVDRKEFFILESIARENFLSYQPGMKSLLSVLVKK